MYIPEPDTDAARASWLPLRGRVATDWNCSLDLRTLMTLQRKKMLRMMTMMVGMERKMLL